MKLIEADGKQLLKNAGINIPRGVFCPFEVTTWPSAEVWSGPVFVKSQVLQGRRGASGLIVRCESSEAFPSVLETLRERIGDCPCAGFLCEPAVEIVGEWFVSVDVDRASGELRAAVSRDGGMDVASAKGFAVREAETQAFPSEIRGIIKRLAAFLEKNDGTHAEINPLAETSLGFVALDAKIELDDAAAFRHPEWSSFHQLSPLGRALTSRERAYEAFLATTGHRGTFGRYLELEGDVALILSGGGASLLALDAMQQAGGRAANYLEASGNPEPEKLREVAKIAFSKPGLRGVWVAGSFANFTDIQATCGAVRQALDDLQLRIPVVIRRDGPNAELAAQEGRAWAAERKIPFAFHQAETSLEASAQHLLSLIV